MSQSEISLNTREYLGLIGVSPLPPLISPFDPGYDPVTLASHLQQSAHLIASLKISMACWIIADEAATKQKIQSAHAHNIPVVTGGGPFEIAVAQGKLAEYLDLCASLNFDRIECGEGFTTLPFKPREIVQMAHERGLTVQYEMGKKHEGTFTLETLDEAVDQGKAWLDAGAECLIVEARESAQGVGMFDSQGEFAPAFGDRLVEAFGLELLFFEAPNKASQFAMLSHFGSDVRLSNVRLEEILRVEIFRRGLHSDAFALPKLRPINPQIK